MTRPSARVPAWCQNARISMLRTIPRLRVAAFGPFGKYPTNPAHTLASSVFAGCETIEVSYEAVEKWLSEVDPDAQMAILIFGVSHTIQCLNLECVARNHTSHIPDVLGKKQSQSVIDAAAASTLDSTLWNESFFDGDSVQWDRSTDAGSYLCNYILFRALSLYPDLKIGFVHVPNYQTSSFQQLQGAARLLGDRIEGYLSSL